ncbi:MAG: iron-sulfur cluster assembly scaffold protein [Planctomycetes bacterium]|nr:iron-sulfur cluster assembly scaffold protein [Planctomycetota bacterium]
MFDSDEEEIYQEHVLDHYEDPYHSGRCPRATHADEGKNPLCGDVVRYELELDETGRIKQVYFKGTGCCISQASASMLAERMDGKTLEELNAFEATEMLELFGPRLTPMRQKCCLLPWRVLKSAVYSPLDTRADANAGATEQSP